MSKCKHLVIRCMDFRLSKKLSLWMKKKGYIGNCDELSYAGASKKLVDETSREVVLADIELAIRKHGVCHIILANHSHCGAYQIEGVDTLKKEKERQLADMREARHIIRQRFPDVSLNIELVWIKLRPRKKQRDKFKLRFRIIKAGEMAA